MQRLGRAFTGSSNEALDNEFYGIDDVSVSINSVSAVPEPCYADCSEETNAPSAPRLKPAASSFENTTDQRS
jgi:hypothetical protein